MQFTIRDATPEDSDKLIELTSLTPMEGVIGLRIDRKPDFFHLLHLSETFILLVAETDKGEIVGCFAATKKNMHIDGKCSHVYYLRDLKVNPDFKGSMVAYVLVKKMYKRLLKDGADILCCTMASGNDAVVPFFQGRAGIPLFSEIAKFSVYQMLPSFEAKFSFSENHCVSRLADFYNSFLKKVSLAPAEIHPQELNNCVNFSAINEENIEAAIAAFDPYEYSQNIVTHYSVSIALILNVLKFLKLFFRLPPLPKKDVPLRIIYAKYYACNQGKGDAFKSLIQQLRHYAFNKNFHFVAIAADEKDVALNKLLKPLSRFVFKSSLLATSLQNNQEVICKMKKSVCYQDYSLV